MGRAGFGQGDEMMGIQAKDIPDDVAMDAFYKARGRNGVPAWASFWDLRDALPQYPQKVVLAKMNSLSKRGVLSPKNNSQSVRERGDYCLPGEEHGRLLAVGAK